MIYSINYVISDIWLEYIFKLQNYMYNKSINNNYLNLFLKQKNH